MRRPNYTRLPLITAAVVVFVAPIGGFLAVRGGASSTSHAGPLIGPQPSSTSVFATALGTPVMVGDWYLANTGSKPAVVQRIALIDPTPGLRVVAINLAHFSKQSRGAESYYPQPGLRLYPVGGLRIPPGGLPQAIEIVAGLAVTKPGHFNSSGLSVSYTVGDRHYTMTVLEGTGVCYPLSAYPNGCPARIPKPPG
jgi:hypothetical protein